MLSATLSVVIPTVVIGYGLWIAVRMFRNRKKGGGCCGGCASCPYAGSCHDPDACRAQESGKKHE